MDHLSSLTASLIALPPRNVLRLMLSFANPVCGFLCSVCPLFFSQLEQIQVTLDASALFHLSMHISTLASIHLSTHPSIHHLSACFSSETACLKFSQMIPEQSCFTLYWKVGNGHIFYQLLVASLVFSANDPYYLLYFINREWYAEDGWIGCCIFIEIRIFFFKKFQQSQRLLNLELIQNRDYKEFSSWHHRGPCIQTQTLG